MFICIKHRTTSLYVSNVCISMWRTDYILSFLALVLLVQKFRKHNFGNDFIEILIRIYSKTNR